MTDGSVEPVLVLGLGNLLLGDDAVGLRVLEELSPAPEGVEFVDGGTQGLALLGRLEQRRAIVILDAVGVGEPPGTVHLLRGAEIDGFRAARASTAHEGSALELLAVAQLLGILKCPVMVVGIEPARVATGIGLSDGVEAAMPGAVERARAILGGLTGNSPPA